VIQDNHALKSGGGIHTANGQLTLDRVVVRDNSTTDGSGGGITIINQLAAITRSYFFNDGAHFFGGAIYATNGTTLNVSSSTFWRDNARLRGGGGIDADELSNLKVVNSTFVSGVTGRDGINIESGRAEVVNSTFSNVNLTGSVELANSILEKVACNSVFDDGLNLQHNSTSCPATIRVADPLTPINLNDHGGPTPTIPIFQGSPAINAISIPNCIDFQKNPIVTDQRGFKRPASTACDIGAFEFGATQ
jgi:predicted outer membrane repeat protein